MPSVILGACNMNFVRNFFSEGNVQKEARTNWFTKERLKELSECNAVLPIDEYKRKASTALHNCHSLLTSNEWQVECRMPNDDVVLYINRPKPEAKIVRIIGTVNAPAKTVIDLLFDDYESGPSWNTLISECTKLQTIDEDTDIVYQVTSPQGGGIIGARDFVILRHREKCGSYYINGGMSVHVESIPNRKNVIRAESGVSCFAAEDLPDEENKCRFTCVVNMNLKGWIPQKIVDKAMSTALVDFLSDLRKHVTEPPKAFV